MKLSRTVAYAVQALLSLADAPAGKPLSCGMLARLGQMPERFLLQVLSGLVRGEVLRSVRGVEGGFLLRRPPEQITLLEICETLDAGLVASVPPLPGLSDETRVQLLTVMTRATAALRAELAQVTLDQLRTPHMPQQLVAEEKSLGDGAGQLA